MSRSVYTALRPVVSVLADMSVAVVQAGQQVLECPR